MNNQNLFYFSCMNLMGLWCVLDESNSVSGFLFMDDGESIGKQCV